MNGSHAQAAEIKDQNQPNTYRDAAENLLRRAAAGPRPSINSLQNAGANRISQSIVQAEASSQHSGKSSSNQRTPRHSQSKKNNGSSAANNKPMMGNNNNTLDRYYPVNPTNS